MKFLVLVLSLGAVVLARPDVSHLKGTAGYHYQPPSTNYGVPVDNGHHYHHQARPSDSYGVPLDNKYAGSGQNHQEVPTGSYLPSNIQFQLPHVNSKIDFVGGNYQYDGYNPHLIQDQKHVYYYAVPDDEEPARLRIHVTPSNKKNTNVIFVKAPSYAPAIPEVVLPQHQEEEKTKVFVLVKKPDHLAPISIQAPAPVKSHPEVYVVKYENQQDAQHIISGGRGGHPAGLSVQNVRDEASFVAALKDDLRKNIANNDKYSGFDGNVNVFQVRSGVGQDGDGSSGYNGYQNTPNFVNGASGGNQVNSGSRDGTFVVSTISGGSGVSGGSQDSGASGVNSGSRDGSFVVSRISGGSGINGGSQASGAFGVPGINSGSHGTFVEPRISGGSVGAQNGGSFGVSGVNRGSQRSSFGVSVGSGVNGGSRDGSFGSQNGGLFGVSGVNGGSRDGSFVVSRVSGGSDDSQVGGSFEEPASFQRSLSIGNGNTDSFLQAPVVSGSVSNSNSDSVKSSDSFGANASDNSDKYGIVTDSGKKGSLEVVVESGKSDEDSSNAGSVSGSIDVQGGLGGSSAGVKTSSVEVESVGQEFASPLLDSFGKSDVEIRLGGRSNGDSGDFVSESALSGSVSASTENTNVVNLKTSVPFSQYGPPGASGPY